MMLVIRKLGSTMTCFYSCVVLVIALPMGSLS